MCVCIGTLYNSLITKQYFNQLNGFIGGCWLAGSGINGGGRKSKKTILYINSITIPTYLPQQTLVVVEGRTVY